MTQACRLNREFISLAVAGAPAMTAYQVLADTEQPAPTVLVGMELFGLSPHVRDICDRVAIEGYNVIAPQFFHRATDDLDLPVGDSGRQRGLELLAQLTRADAVADLQAVAAWIAAHGASLQAMVGLSLGGNLAYLAATQLDVPLSMVFYGGWLTDSRLPLGRPEPTVTMTPNIRGRVRIFVGDEDPIVPPADVRQLRAALIASDINHEVTQFPGVGHGFLATGRPTFDPTAAEDAWAEVVRELRAV